MSTECATWCSMIQIILSGTQDLTAAILGTVAINHVRGPVIMVQRDTVINFQIERPLEMEAVEAALGVMTWT